MDAPSLNDAPSATPLAQPASPKNSSALRRHSSVPCDEAFRGIGRCSRNPHRTSTRRTESRWPGHARAYPGRFAIWADASSPRECSLRDNGSDRHPRIPAETGDDPMCSGIGRVSLHSPNPRSQRSYRSSPWRHSIDVEPPQSCRRAWESWSHRSARSPLRTGEPPQPALAGDPPHADDPMYASPGSPATFWEPCPSRRPSARRTCGERSRVDRAHIAADARDPRGGQSSRRTTVRIGANRPPADPFVEHPYSCPPACCR